MIIYSIRNTVNGKQLIGQSVTRIAQRCKVHRCQARNGKHGNRHFQAAWNKYGEAAFEFLVIDETAKDINQLNALETFYIATTPNLYNLKNGGSNGRPSAETRRKISEALRGRTFSIEHRRRIGEVQKGRKRPPFTVEHKLALGKALKGKKHPADCKHCEALRKH